MKILWYTWKDLSHPLAGGAEVVSAELAKRLAQDGHEVKLVVGNFAGGKPHETRDGYEIIRVGGRYSVYWHAWRLYRKELAGWADLVIDEINTAPFFTKFYVQERNVIFIHQLAREIWFYEMPFPLSFIGFLLEPIYLWLLRDRDVITVSKSTRDDLCGFGFSPERVSIISEGIHMKPVGDLSSLEKFEHPTILFMSALRPMKRVEKTLEAFHLAKNHIPDLELIIAGGGSGSYARHIQKRVHASIHARSIHVLGRVSEETKRELLQKSHILSAASVREGWGLIVTEANSQGTPAVVYNVPGLRDSVRHRSTGLICGRNTPEDLAANYLNLLTMPQYYENTRARAWHWSKEITFDRSYQDFTTALGIVKQ